MVFINFLFFYRVNVLITVIPTPPASLNRHLLRVLDPTRVNVGGLRTRAAIAVMLVLMGLSMSPLARSPGIVNA